MPIADVLSALKKKRMGGPLALASALSLAVTCVVGLHVWTLGIIALVAILVVLPRWQVSLLAQSGKPAEWIEAEHKVRVALVQVIGVFVLLAGAYSAWNQFQNQRDQLAEQRKQFTDQAERQDRQAAEQRRQFELQLQTQQRQLDAQRAQSETQARHQHEQLVDQREQFRLQFNAAREENAALRYAQTAEQLSSEALEIRLAAVSALVVMARRTTEDKWIVLEILTSYVRRRAPAPAQRPSNEEVRNLAGLVAPPGPPGARWPVQPPTDIQLVLQFIASNDWSPPVPPPGRRQGDWDPTFQMRKFAFESRYRVNLSGANLSGSLLSEAKLDHADLSGASLYCASLSGASLRYANLAGVDARLASLGNATLDGATLEGADFTEAYMRATSLRNTNLHGATILPGGPVRTSDFEGAQTNGQTKLPGNIRGYLASRE